uniref:IrrE N-terminal-like domain-containing protein n=1 Tax=uncultured Spirochaetaceae bacterium TaxID=201186 RepID=A0A650EQA1_9SPIO|nr:hypothetical protein Unknown280_1500 [uncultured Spirochaetaceae bacterium]
MNYSEIEENVKNTLKSAQYIISERSVDVIDVAKRLGFVVGNAVLNEEDDGFIVVEEGAEEIMGIKTDKLIGVNSNRSLEWKRFIIAHELGHYVLHFKKKNLKGLYAHRDHKRGHSELENEADFFAANLLMPRESFEKKYTKIKQIYKNDKEIVDALSKHFIVTIRMAERRIEELKLA